MRCTTPPTSQRRHSQQDLHGLRNGPINFTGSGRTASTPTRLKGFSTQEEETRVRKEQQRPQATRKACHREVSKWGRIDVGASWELLGRVSGQRTRYWLMLRETVGLG